MANDIPRVKVRVVQDFTTRLNVLIQGFQQLRAEIYEEAEASRGVTKSLDMLVAEADRFIQLAPRELKT